MARYSLRNQDRITKEFGKDYLDLLKQSLTEAFKKEDIEEHTYENINHKVIHATNVQPRTDSFFEFLIISKHFDVYNLAYHSCAG